VVDPRPALSITVGFALVKGAKPELVVQKLTELGVDHIRPFVAARSVVRWDDAKACSALERWRKVVTEAGRQSRQAWLPEVHEVTTFAGVAALPGAHRADRGGQGFGAEVHTLLVGPEGGWDRDEMATPLPTVSLGPGVLRAETAAITGGALLVALRAGLVAPAV
jgi:16S rRNA (uracil1498-N3)-methyltransferase